jgi:hypothetical protein
VTTPVTAAALTGATDHETGVAAGVLNTSRKVGLTLGIALMSAIVAARWPGGFAISPASPGGLAGGLAIAYRVNAGIALATAGLAAAIRGTGVAAVDTSDAAGPPRSEAWLAAVKPS